MQSQMELMVLLYNENKKLDFEEGQSHSVTLPLSLRDIVPMPIPLNHSQKKRRKKRKRKRRKKKSHHEQEVAVGVRPFHLTRNNGGT